jgi:putative oxidoreductase
MKKLIFSTKETIAPLLLRLFLAIVLFPHGAQKLLGWFDGPGFDGSMQYFTETKGLPTIMGFIVILIEFFGPIALLLGFATRIWSAAIFFVMAGVILTTFHEFFFMNWYGTQKAEGMEFFLLAIGMSLSLALSGAGRFSIDAYFGKSIGEGRMTDTKRKVLAGE